LLASWIMPASQPWTRALVWSEHDARKARARRWAANFVFALVVACCVGISTLVQLYGYFGLEVRRACAPGDREPPALYLLGP